jgi:hypothetical protein
VVVVVLGVGSAVADPVAAIPTDPVAPGTPAPPPVLRPSWDLDGTYLWLGPTGAASWLDGWDSTFGGVGAVVRVRERELVGTIGGAFGASRWTAHGGGRLWLETLVGTRVMGHMVGLSGGPILELAETTPPRFGGSVGLWAFAGLTPYVRVGVVESAGTFAEIGIHLVLPVIRR